MSELPPEDDGLKLEEARNKLDENGIDPQQSSRHSEIHTHVFDGAGLFSESGSEDEMPPTLPPRG